MYNPVIVAKAILYYSRRYNPDGISLNKLHKLIYLVAEDSATTESIWPFERDVSFTPTARGPSLTAVADYFKDYAFYETLSVSVVRSEIEHVDIRSIDRVVKRFSHTPPWLLIDLIMGPGTINWQRCHDDSTAAITFSDVRTHS